jgi:hypothetical protein
LTTPAAYGILASSSDCDLTEPASEFRGGFFHGLCGVLAVAMTVLTQAEYQGFDDGYFGNPRQMSFDTEAEGEAYDKGFARGEAQKPKKKSQ